MKSALRSIKNEIKKYDEGQRMVRAITANTEEVPAMAQLNELTNYCRNDMVSGPTYDVLWQRLTDYQTLRHVEKALLVIEHLINYGTKKFIRVCLARKSEFQKLTKYVYKVDGSDIGQNVRTRAKECYRLLQDERIINKTTSYVDMYSSATVSNDYGGSSRKSDAAPTASYDDYFSTVDKVDAENMMKREREKEEEENKKREKEKERERELEREKEEENKKREKKKKKKSLKKSKSKKSVSKKKKEKKKKDEQNLIKQESVMSSGDDNDAHNDPFSGAAFDDGSDPFSGAAFGSNKPQNNGAQNNDPFNGATFSSNEPQNNDTFWASDNKKNVSSKAPPKQNMNKLKSVSLEDNNHNNNGDDLLGFFNSSPVVNNNTNHQNTSNNNGYSNVFNGNASYNQVPQQQATQSPDPFASNNQQTQDPFASNNQQTRDPFAANQDPFSSTTTKQTQDPFAATNKQPFAANNGGDIWSASGTTANTQNMHANVQQNDNPFTANAFATTTAHDPFAANHNYNNGFTQNQSNNFVQNNNNFAQNNNHFAQNNNNFAQNNNNFAQNQNNKIDPFAALGF